MKKYRLNVVTENQNSIEKAKKLSDIISVSLGCQNQVSISKYEKFTDSYSIDFSGYFVSDKNLINDSIELTDRICSPWSVKLNRHAMEVELIFNKTEFSIYKENCFNVIKWAIFEIDN